MIPLRAIRVALDPSSAVPQRRLQYAWRNLRRPCTLASEVCSRTLQLDYWSRTCPPAAWLKSPHSIKNCCASVVPAVLRPRTPTLLGSRESANFSGSLSYACHRTALQPTCTPVLHQLRCGQRRIYTFSPSWYIRGPL
jgi:hypothetical protein